MNPPRSFANSSWPPTPIPRYIFPSSVKVKDIPVFSQHTHPDPNHAGPSPLSWEGVEDETLLPTDFNNGESSYDYAPDAQWGPTGHESKGVELEQGKWVRNEWKQTDVTEPREPEAPSTDDASLPSPEQPALCHEDLPAENSGTIYTPVVVEDDWDVKEVGSTVDPESIIREDFQSSFSSSSTSESSDLHFASYPNDNDTRLLFHFKKYGKKGYRGAKDAKEDKREYYKCTHKDCDARYYITTDTHKNTKLYQYKSSFHNHLPPHNPHVRPDVKAKAIAQMSVGATPSNVHSQIVVGATLPLSSADVPTIGMLKNWKHGFFMKDMPTGDVLQNIVNKHGEFVKECKIYPIVHVVMASAFGLGLLTRSTYVICDGTFDTTECKLVLTTLLGFHEDIAIPCAYLLSNSKETDNYEAFYRTVKRATKEKMSPEGVLLDFEEALSQGFTRVFPEASVLCDFFHLVQANVKKIGQLGLKSLQTDVVGGVRSMWYAPTVEDFKIAVTAFLGDWDNCAPAYATYFRRNWLNRFPPEKWASYARPHGAPSGSGSAEGFHNRLEINMPRASLPLDKMVDFLAAEDEYWNRVVHDSRLWQEKKTAHAASQERHRTKRRMLKHYVERGTIPKNPSINISISNDLLSDSDDSTDIIDLVDTADETELLPSVYFAAKLPRSEPTAAESDIETKRSRKPRKPNPNIPMNQRCIKCKVYKVNGECSLAMCKTCCIASVEHCKEFSHKKAKLGARQPLSVLLPLPTPLSQQLKAPPTTANLTAASTLTSGIRQRIEDAIQSCSDIFIAYQKGTNGIRARKIKPTGFTEGKLGALVSSYCYISKDTRSFYVHLISRIEYFDWTGGDVELTLSEEKPAPSPSVKEWLDKMQLGCYWEAFKENGYDILEALIGLDQTKLNSINIIKAGHQALLIRKAKLLTQDVQ